MKVQLQCRRHRQVQIQLQLRRQVQRQPIFLRLRPHRQVLQKQLRRLHRRQARNQLRLQVQVKGQRSPLKSVVGLSGTIVLKS